MSFTNRRLHPGPNISGLKEIGYGVAAPIPGAKGIGQDHTTDGHRMAAIGKNLDGDGDGNLVIGNDGIRIIAS